MRWKGKAQRAHVPLKLKYCTWARKRRDILSAVNQINWILIIKKCAEGLEDHKEALTLHTGSSSTFGMWLHYGWIAVSAPISEMYPERQFQNWTSAASNHPLSSAENANSLPCSTFRLGSWLNSVDWILNVGEGGEKVNYTSTYHKNALRRFSAKEFTAQGFLFFSAPTAGLFFTGD